MSDFRAAGSIFAAQFDDIMVASFGNSFTNGSGVFEAMHIGLRGTDGSVEVKPRTYDDGIMRPVADRLYDVTIKFRQYENRIVDVLNAYYISNVSGGTDVGAQCRILMADGKYLNFTKAAGTVTSPTAVGVVGFSYKFVCNQKERYIEWTGNVTINEAEYTLLVDTTFWSSAAVGDTGGAVLGLVASGYSRANYKVPGVNTITIASNTYGIPDETFEFTLESVPNSQKDYKYRPINRKSKATLKFGLPQTAAADLSRALLTVAETDTTITLNLMSGETVTFNSGAIIINPTFITGDKDRTQMYEGGGTFQNNKDEASPTSLDLGFTSPLVANFYNLQSL